MCRNSSVSSFVRFCRFTYLTKVFFCFFILYVPRVFANPFRIQTVLIHQDWFGVDIFNSANFHLKIAQTISIIGVITKSVHTAQLRNGTPLYRPQTNANKQKHTHNAMKRRREKKWKIDNAKLLYRLQKKNDWNERENTRLYIHTRKLNRKLIIGALLLATDWIWYQVNLCLFLRFFRSFHVRRIQF